MKFSSRKTYTFLVSTLQLQILQFYFNFCLFQESASSGICFHFPQFPQNFVFKKFSILWHIGLLDMYLHRSPKTALKNTQNSPLYSILKLTFLRIFKNESFRFSQYSQKFSFDLCLGSSDCLKNYWDVLKSVGKVVEKF